MRADAAELYRRWWPVALRYAARWAQSDADAEDIAAAAIIAFIEEAPAGLSDRAIERALSRSISRSREVNRRSRRAGYLSVVDAEEPVDPDPATWERVRGALDAADLSLFDRAVPGAATPVSHSAIASRRYRVRKRAAAAAVSVDGPGAGPTCARYVALIPEVARRTATGEQRSALLEHTLQCDFCDQLLADRRSVAHRWKIAGALPGFGALRRWGWRWWGPGAAHPVAATGAVATTAAVVLAAVVVPILVLAPGTTTAAVARSTTTTTAAVAWSTTTTTPPPTASTTDTAPATTATTTPLTTTTTTPDGTATAVAPVRWGVRAQALAQPGTGGTVAVDVLAVATRDGAADAGDVLTFSSACGTARQATGPGGTASVQLSCPAADFPVTVTVTDAAGVATEVEVDGG